MKRLIIAVGYLCLAACFSLSLAACGLNTGIASAGDAAVSVADAVGVKAPAPLAGTKIDNKAIDILFASYDEALHLVDVARDAGKLPRGSVRAVAVADAVHTSKFAMKALASAQKAGDQARLSIAYADAKAAVAAASAALNKD